MDDPTEPSEAEVDAVADEFGGDLREAVRALLHDIAVLAADLAFTVSRGYVRGNPSSTSMKRARRKRRDAE